MIIRGFNVSLGSCGFSYVFSCLRLLSDVGIKKIHIGNRYVRKAWNLAFSIMSLPHPYAIIYTALMMYVSILCFYSLYITDSI